MLAEGLLVLGCVSGDCSKTMSAYDSYNPYFKERKEQVQTIIYNNLGSNYLAPVLGAAVNGSVDVYSDQRKKLSLGYRDSVGFIFFYNF